MTNMNPQNPGQKEQPKGQPGKDKEQRDRDNNADKSRERNARPSGDGSVSE